MTARIRARPLAILLIGLMACSSERLTSNGGPSDSPLPPGPGPQLTIRGFVVDDSGGCIEGASVRIEQGQGLDQSAAQQTPCDAARQSGGFELRNLLPGISLSIRASAPGFVSRVTTLIPAAGQQPSLTIVLAKSP